MKLPYSGPETNSETHSAGPKRTVKQTVERGRTVRFDPGMFVLTLECLFCRVPVCALDKRPPVCLYINRQPAQRME